MLWEEQFTLSRSRQLAWEMKKRPNEDKFIGDQNHQVIDS